MILKDASQVTLDYLRRILVQQGEVAAFTVEQTQATHALVARVHITYTTKNGTAPEALFLKCVPAGDSFGSSEVDYYRRDYLGLSDIPIPMCYDAAYDSATGAYHLLLQNLSDTHHNNHGTAPTLGYGLTLAEALARLHAPYFSAGALAHIGEYQPDEPKMQRYVDVMTLGIEPMLAAVSADITPQQHQLVRDVAHYHPRLLLDRVNDPTGLTLVHGDANPGNILSSQKRNNADLSHRSPAVRLVTDRLAGRERFGVHDGALVGHTTAPRVRDTCIATLSPCLECAGYHQRLG